MRCVALFLIFSSQIVLYAATAHVANDWLAIPAHHPGALIAAIKFFRTPRAGGPARCWVRGREAAGYC